jgi:hypothetical protein
MQLLAATIAPLSDGFLVGSSGGKIMPNALSMLALDDIR